MTNFDYTTDSSRNHCMGVKKRRFERLLLLQTLCQRAPDPDTDVQRPPMLWVSRSTRHTPYHLFRRPYMVYIPQAPSSSKRLMRAEDDEHENCSYVKHDVVKITIVSSVDSARDVLHVHHRSNGTRLSSTAGPRCCQCVAVTALVESNLERLSGRHPLDVAAIT